MNEVYMEVPAVRQMAKNFQTISEVLSTVNKVLEAMLMILKTTAFVGLVGGAAVAGYIEMIKPYVEQWIEKTAELSRDLNASVDAYERGDAQGATRFY
ncbi:MAG TPA: hypothetical protein ENJ35_04460 [Gammaproteobacteria bacterium]|nr:hypothetical protein [Gammaproteobacteria bacterium]